MSQRRCKYTWPEDFDHDDRHIRKIGQHCCWRKSTQDSPYCLLHAKHQREDSNSTNILQKISTSVDREIQSHSCNEPLDGADLHGIDLRNAGDLNGVSLRDANLSDSNLSHVDLSDSDLTGANFRDAILRHTDFTRACLRDAVLENADLKGITIKGADLYSANLSGLDLRSVNFNDTNLAWANLTDTNLREANLTEASSLTDANFAEANLRGADFSGAVFYRGCFHKSDLTNVNFNRTRIKEADLSRSTLIRGDLSDGFFDYGKFIESDMSGANCSNTQMRCIDFTGASLVGADLSGADLSHSDLSGVDLSDADLSNANLTDTDFTDAILYDVELQNADLSDTNIPDANLSSSGLASTIAQIVKAFGSSEATDIDSNISDCIVGNKKVIMWFPDGKKKPLGFDLGKFTDKTAYERGYIPDESDEPGSRSPLYAVRHKESVEFVNSHKIEKLADALGTSIELLMESAQIHKNNENDHLAVIFDLEQYLEFHEGHILIASLDYDSADVEYE